MGDGFIVPIVGVETETRRFVLGLALRLDRRRDSIESERTDADADADARVRSRERSSATLDGGDGLETRGIGRHRPVVQTPSGGEDAVITARSSIARQGDGDDVLDVHRGAVNVILGVVTRKLQVLEKHWRSTRRVRRSESIRGATGDPVFGVFERFSPGDFDGE